MKLHPLSKQAVLAKGALMAALPAIMAVDAKLDLNALLQGVNGRNWKERKAAIAAGVAPVLAADAELSDVIQLLDKLDGEVGEIKDMEKQEAAGAGVHAEAAPPDNGTGSGEEDDGLATDSPADALMSMLRGKISDEDMTAVEAWCAENCAPAAADEFPPKDDDNDEEDLMKKKAAAKDAATDPKLKPAPITKAAMDAAIALAVKGATEAATQRTLKLARSIAAAEAEVRPSVGALALAQDSAEGVYKAALEVLGVTVEGVHPSAYRAIFAAQPKPGAQLRLAKDSTADVTPKDYATRFPDAGRLEVA